MGNSVQMIAGKAFEYALINQLQEKLEDVTTINIIKNSSYIIAERCFLESNENERSKFLLYSSFAINFLCDLEPRLSNDIGKDDILELELASDDRGKLGDVRDIIIIRALQKWEIGISAKNNHSAVKHSRLSAKIDFGKQWLGTNCSNEYFNEIIPIFKGLEYIKKSSNGTKKWNEIGNYHEEVYFPTLKAFVKEFLRLSKEDINFSKKLVQYLVGINDFYKVIKSNKNIKIYGYNFNNTLNLPFENINAKYKIPLIELPTQLINMRFKDEKSRNTVIAEFDKDWTLSFRIHNASSRIEPSLKFDIQLLKSPESLFINTLKI